MVAYKMKFPLMAIDNGDEFREAMKEALKDEDYLSRSGELRLPCIKRDPDEDGPTLLALSQEAFDDDFCDWSQPRNEFEAQLSNQGQERRRLEYPEERAPFQYTLQKKTSEVALSVQPPVKHLTQLQIAASRVRAEKSEQKVLEARGLEKKKSFVILNESEDLMRAQVKKGRLYAALNEEQKKAFNEILLTPPPEERIQWLLKKLNHIESYSEFLDLITFCHPEQSVDGDFQFVLNYVHQDFMLPVIRQKFTEEHQNRLKTFYARLYEADALLSTFVSGALKSALEHANFYPEPPPSKYLQFSYKILKIQKY